MKVGIVGLGLIGGSLARAAKRCNHYVYGYDISGETLDKALRSGVVDAVMSAGKPDDCDLVLIALYPDATVEYVRNNAGRFKGIVVDCCGVKSPVCTPCFELARRHDFVFIGGHPMAGREISGFDASLDGLFEGRSMILVPDQNTDAETLERTEMFFKELGFGCIIITSADEHDHAIAYTSQLAHVLSSSYMQIGAVGTGFAADSFADLTRVARMNVEMWSELFLQNSDALSTEIDKLICTLSMYSRAIKNHDADGLSALISNGTRMKEALL